jgi:hypothetical protein
MEDDLRELTGRLRYKLRHDLVVHSLLLPFWVMMLFMGTYSILYMISTSSLDAEGVFWALVILLIFIPVGIYSSSKLLRTWEDLQLLKDDPSKALTSWANRQRDYLGLFDEHGKPTRRFSVLTILVCAVTLAPIVLFFAQKMPTWLSYLGEPMATIVKGIFFVFLPLVIISAILLLIDIVRSWKRGSGS